MFRNAHETVKYPPAESERWNVALTGLRLIVPTLAKLGEVLVIGDTAAAMYVSSMAASEVSLLATPSTSMREVACVVSPLGSYRLNSPTAVSAKLSVALVIVLAAVVLGERLTWAKGIGGLLIVAGAVVIALEH